jgi:hypothetical protein
MKAVLTKPALMLNLLTSFFRKSTKRKSIRLCALLLFIPSVILAQGDSPKKSESNSPENFSALQQQAEYFYGLRKSKEADSVIGKLIFVAEQSMDHRLMKAAFFENPVFTSEVYFSHDDAKKSKYYIDRALEYARRVNKQDLIAFAYIKSRLLRKYFKHCCGVLRK